VVYPDESPQQKLTYPLQSQRYLFAPLQCGQLPQHSCGPLHWQYGIFLSVQFLALCMTSARVMETSAKSAASFCCSSVKCSSSHHLLCSSRTGTAANATEKRSATANTVRLVFRPYSHVRRTICTSVSLQASTRISSGFTMHTNRSPSFGSHFRFITKGDHCTCTSASPSSSNWGTEVEIETFKILTASLPGFASCPSVAAWGSPFASMP